MEIGNGDERKRKRASCWIEWIRKVIEKERRRARAKGKSSEQGTFYCSSSVITMGNHHQGAEASGGVPALEFEFELEQQQIQYTVEG